MRLFDRGKYCIVRVASPRARGALSLGLVGLRGDPHDAIFPALIQGGFVETQKSPLRDSFGRR